MDLASGIKANVYGMVLNTALNVGANVLLARYCLANHFGVLNFVTNNLAILLLVISLGLEAGIGYALVQKTIPKERLASLALLVTPAVILFVFLLLPLFNFSLGFFNSQLLVSFSLLFLAGNLLLNVSAPFYQAEGRYKRVTTIGAFFNAGLCALGITFLVLDPEHEYLKLFVLLYAALYFLYGLFLSLKPLTYLRRNGFALPTKKQLQPFFRYAFSALAANLLFLLVYRVDYWFVEAYCSNAALGNYIQASKLGQLFLLLPTFIATPVFFTSDATLDGNPARVLPLITRWVFVATLAALVLALLLGYYLFDVIYGPTFDQVFVCLLGLAIGITALSVNRIICAFWARSGQVQFNIIGNAIALAAIVLLDALFIKRYGIVAAALISSVGYVLFLTFNLILLKRKYGVRLLPFFVPALGDMAFLKTRLLNRV